MTEEPRPAIAAKVRGSILVSPGEFAEVLARGYKIRLVACFGGFVMTKKLVLPIDRDTREPLPLVCIPADAFIAGRVIRPAPSVAQVLASCGDPQIDPAIVISHAIDVVYFIGRPFAGHIKPCKPMCSVALNSAPHEPITISGRAIRSPANSRFIAARDQIGKGSGLRIVMNQSAQFFGCDHLVRFELGKTKRRPNDAAEQAGSRAVQIGCSGIRADAD